MSSSLALGSSLYRLSVKLTLVMSCATTRPLYAAVAMLLTAIDNTAAAHLLPTPDQ